MKILGIPDEWELVRIGRANLGEHYLTQSGKIVLWDVDEQSDRIYPIVRKVEKPKQYRPFENAAEFAPHRDRWIQRSGKHDTPDTIPAGCFRVTAYNDHHYWTNGVHCTTFEQAFHDGKCFDDGTPFGIEVTE